MDWAWLISIVGTISVLFFVIMLAAMLLTKCSVTYNNNQLDEVFMPKGVDDKE